MTNKHEHDQVRSRNESFAERASTKIWKEIPAEDNPYITEDVLCHGYNLFSLMEKKSYVEVLYLLLRGELPTRDEKEILETLMISIINPGPRHPATRAAMNAGIGKTLPGHILPISSSILSGDYLGGGLIESAMRFFRKNQNKDPKVVLESIQSHENSKDLTWLQKTPGFDKVSGSIDRFSVKIANKLSSLNGAGKALNWGCQLNQTLTPENIGWTTSGVAAAVFADLGFHPRAGICLFQLMCSPGLIAHGIELANKPITSMPYVKDENYVIER